MEIVGRPAPLGREVYSAALARFVERATMVPGVRAVFTMGSVRSLGLSDLDVVVVATDDAREHTRRALGVHEIDDRVFLHGAVILPERLAGSLQAIVHATNLELVWGNANLQATDAVPESTRRSLALAYLIDMMESRMVEYAWAKHRREVNQRSWIPRLWSLTHSRSLASTAGVTLGPEAAETIREIEVARERWFSVAPLDDDAFLDIMDRAEQAVRAIFIQTLRSAYGADVPLTKGRIRMGSKEIRFTPETEVPRYSVRESRFGRTRVRTMYAVHPLSYRAHIENYGTVPDAETYGDAGLRHVLRWRAATVRDHWDWIARSFPTSGAMVGYLGFSPRRQGGLRVRVHDGLSRLFHGFA